MSIQANINLLHFPSGTSVSGGGRRTPNEGSFATNAVSLTTASEVVPKGDIITPRYVAIKNYEGDDALISLDGGSTWPFRLSPDNDVLLLRLNLEDYREISTFVCEADTAGSLSGEHLEIYDHVGEVWPWFNITDFTSVKEISTITTVADVAASLDAKYFVISDNVGTVGVWFDVDNNGTTIPSGASACARSIEVTTIVTGDSANTVATKVAAVLEADSKFVATAATNIVTVTDANYGARTNLTAGDSGFTMAVTTQGVSGINPSTAPAVTTERLIQVDITVGSTAVQVAVALAAAMDADAEFIAAVPTTSTAVITDQNSGARAAATAGDTGWASVTSGNQGTDFYDVEIKSVGTSQVVTAVCPN
jgi:hypothetical protein